MHLNKSRRTCAKHDDDSGMIDFFFYFQISVMFYLTNIAFLHVSDTGMRETEKTWSLSLKLTFQYYSLTFQHLASVNIIQKENKSRYYHS